MDSKYEGLPGIARNEPDVYETSDVTQTDVKYVEDDSSNVPKIIINQREVYEKFNKSNLNSRYVDFSGSIGTDRLKSGYIIDRDLYEWNKHETPIQKFNRLQHEMNELKNDLKDLKLNDELSLEFDPLELLNKVECLKNQVTHLQLERVGAISKVDGGTKKQLLIDHLGDLKKSLSKVQESVVKENEDKSLVFKIFNDLESSDFNKTSKISDLNQRLDRLEVTLGANKNDKLISSLCANSENKSILGILDNLNLKLSLLTPESIDQIDSKLQMIVQKVNQINEKRQTIQDQEKLGKVTRLFDMINKWKDVTDTLPSIIDRLAVLNDIHQQAFNFSASLNRIDSEQTLIKQTLDTNIDSLNKVSDYDHLYLDRLDFLTKKFFDIYVKLKSNMDKNLESIRENFDKLNERIIKIGSATNV